MKVIMRAGLRIALKKGRGLLGRHLSGIPSTCVTRDGKHSK